MHQLERTIYEQYFDNLWKFMVINFKEWYVQVGIGTEESGFGITINPGSEVLQSSSQS